jgi:hypothetical protein
MMLKAPQLTPNHTMKQLTVFEGNVDKNILYS